MMWEHSTVYAHPGSPACSLYAMAGYLHVGLGVDIAESVLHELFVDYTQKRYGKSKGITIAEAFAVLMRAGYVPDGTRMFQAADFDMLAHGPMIAGMQWPVEWNKPGVAILPYASGMELEKSTHAVVVVGCDPASGDVMMLNSHGNNWGVNGVASVARAGFDLFVRDLWHVVLPGRPMYPGEAVAQSMARNRMIRETVTALRNALVLLGFDLPCSVSKVIVDVASRANAGTLSRDQQDAKRDLASAYLLLAAQKVHDEMIAEVWKIIREKG